MNIPVSALEESNLYFCSSMRKYDLGCFANKPHVAKLWPLLWGFLLLFHIYCILIYMSAQQQFLLFQNKSGENRQLVNLHIKIIYKECTLYPQNTSLYKSHIYLPITETVTAFMEMYSVTLSHDDVISRSLLIQDILSIPVALNIAKATEEPDENISILTCTIKMNKRQSAEGTQQLLIVVESNICIKVLDWHE